MKYAAVVLRNIRNPALTVKFGQVADALLSGGIPLEVISLVAYDEGNAVVSTLRSLAEKYDVFVICDRVLLPAARDAVYAVSGKKLKDYLLETDTRLYAVLPAGERGKEIVETEVVPAVNRRRRQSFHSIVIRTVSAPADAVLHAVAAAQEEAEDKLIIHTGEQFGAGRIEVIYDDRTPKVIADEVVRILASELERYVYAMEDVTIGQRLFEVLKLHRLKISTAESFTGGGVGREIVKNPGASAVFYEGLNTYDSKSKVDRLGVTEYTLKDKGTVSSETAYEMAAGLLRTGNCDVAVSTTGIAGPKSDLSGKPAGLCFIGVGTKERVRVFEFHLDGDRETITKKAVNLALFLAYKEVN